MRKKFSGLKKIFVFLITFINIVSPFLSSQLVYAADISSTNTVKYQAFTNGGYRHSSNNYDVYSGALFLRELGSRDTGQNSITAFCFNAGRTMPPEITVLDAGFDSVIVNTKYDRESNVSSLYEYSDSPALNKEEFNKKIKQILYNGYPTNGSNFNSGTDSISLSAFRRATQKAIWAYTDGGADMNIDNVVDHFQFPQNEKNMLRRLLEATNDVPNNFVVDFYRADTQGMQNIVTGRIDSSTPEVPKEKDIVISKVNLGGEEIAGAKIQINQGNKEVASWTSEAGKNHELSLLPGDYVFHEEAAPKGYVVVTDITFTVNTDGTVTVKDANGNKVVAANNQLTVTDETEYVNPTGTLRTTVKADSTVANATKAAEVTAEKAATGVEVTDTLTYEDLVPEKVYSVTGELYEVKDGQVVGTAKATATKEFTVSKEGKGEWQLAFGQVTGLEAGKTYVVYETATSKDNLVDRNKDNTPEEKHVVEHKNPGDKAQTVVVTPEVPKEKDIVISKVNLGGEEIAGA
ncbi:thioester-forming surface-anchored protein, partial [Enterococcus gallinarum]|uniref:thioester-forming surface-anchored protein n=1 Tax=Enterococcus gallinarum TaxID=1353 RepID=UPI001F58BDEC